jgi:predicted house-cleaning noncanonical NTP pyrophosphatase (MazG superfamily)
MKLVRENVAKRIISENPLQITQACNSMEFLVFLKLKLSEELQELKETNYSDAMEYADVLEVLETLALQHGLTFEKLLEAKNIKLQTEGNLKRGMLFNNAKK